MKTYRPMFTVILAVFVLLTLFTSQLQALPRYSAKYKQSCSLCHQNPTGGGMRNLYGAQFFSYTELPVKPMEDLSQLDKINPMLNKNVQVGFDFRTIYWKSDDELVGNSFLAMHGDLYMAFSPSERMTVYIEKGIHSAFEAFALLKKLPMSGTLKAGRFIPAYGWRFVDHKSFVRDFLGFSQYPDFGPRLVEDTGLELGFYPEKWEAVFGLTNGGSGPIDYDKGKAFTTRVLKRLAIGDLQLTFGGSYRYGEFGSDDPLLRYGGGLWGLNYQNLSYVGETDWLIKPDVTGMVNTHQLSYRVHPGWDMILGWDQYNSDIDDENITPFWRGKISSEIFLTGYLELIPAFYWHEYDGKEYGTGEIQLHVWY